MALGCPRLLRLALLMPLLGACKAADGGASFGGVAQGGSTEVEEQEGAFEPPARTALGQAGEGGQDRQDSQDGDGELAVSEMGGSQVPDDFEADLPPPGDKAGSTDGQGMEGSGDEPAPEPTPLTSCIDPTPAPQDAPYAIDVRQNYYIVDADTLAGLREQLDMRSPSPLASRVEWRIFWSFDWDACDGSGLEVGIEIDYWMPHWQAPEGVAQSVTDGWSNFIDALWCHEYGHVQFGIAVAEEAYLALAELADPVDCADLADRGWAAFNPILDQYRASEIAYDESTNDGETMGARLPID